MKDTKEGFSAVLAGSLFHIGIVRGKKLFLKVSVDVEYCLYWRLWWFAALVLEVTGVKYFEAGIST